MKSFRAKFGIGDVVYLKTDSDQDARMVIMISFDSKGCEYTLALGGFFSTHQDIEISTDRNTEYSYSMN